MKERVRGTVHDISASGATYYIEPQEITPLNNRALMLEKELQAETGRILRAPLGKGVAENAGPLRGNLDVIGGLDFLARRGPLQHRHQGLGAGDIGIERHRPLPGAPSHPVPHVAGHGRGQRHRPGRSEPVPHHFRRQHGREDRAPEDHRPVRPLRHARSPRPGRARFAHRRLFADPGGYRRRPEPVAVAFDLLRPDRGHQRDAPDADERTLVIIDEIIVGTNPRQGAALAQAILESLIETGSRIVVTTHYSELKDLPTIDGRFQNASVSFDMDTLRPTYRLITGLPGVSYAIEIARNYGFPDRIIDRSRSLLDSRELSVEALIEKMQKHEQELTDKKTRLEEIDRRPRKGKERVRRADETPGKALPGDQAEGGDRVPRRAEGIPRPRDRAGSPIYSG